MPQTEGATFELLESLDLSSELREATLVGLGWRPPWSQLATVDGWVLRLGHPPIPEDIDLIPAPGQLVWDDPTSALGVAAAVSLRYAVLRGASPSSLGELLAREAPLAVLVPGDLHPTVHERLSEVEQLGVPVVYAPTQTSKSIQDLPVFAARRDAHAFDIGRPHDPVFSFEEVRVDEKIGGNSLSSFVLHPEGEHDGVAIAGESSDRIGIEIGLHTPTVGVPESTGLESEAAGIPSFMEGVVSNLESQSLAIGWSTGYEPSPEQVGGVLRAWLKALYRLDLVDVRIVFAPEHGRSARLVDMRERARQYAEYRASLIADLDNVIDYRAAMDESNA